MSDSTSIISSGSGSDDSNSDPRLKKEELLSALDTQIKFEADSQRNEGWTHWAIWGAIAALIWIATDLWVQPGLEISRMVIVSLLIFVSWKFLEAIIWALLPSSHIVINSVRFRPSADTIHPLRPAIAVAVVQYALILSALGYFNMWSLCFLWAYAIVAFLGCSSMLIFDRLTIGFPEQVKTTTIINGMVFLQLICLFCTGFQIVRFAITSWATFSQADFRFALVLNSGTFLISKLVTANSTEHLLSKLTQLRQHLAFGRIPLKDAIEKSEELLTGITLEKLLRPLVNAINQEEAKLQKILLAANRSLDEANEMMNTSGQGSQEAIRLLDRMGAPPTAVADQLIENKRAWTRFAGQAVGIAIYSQESREEIKMTSQKIREKLVDVDAKLNACYTRYNELKKEACGLVAASQNHDTV